MKIANKTALILAMGSMVACAHHKKDNPQVFGAPTDAAKEAVDITNNDDLEKKPGKFLNQEVKLTGDVEEVVNDRAFRMEVDNFMGQDEILVVNETGYAVPVKKGDFVEVKGPVKIFVASDVEKDVDPEVIDKLYPKFGNQPMIVAEVITGYWAEHRPTAKTETVRRGDRERTRDRERMRERVAEPMVPGEVSPEEEAPSH